MIIGAVFLSLVVIGLLYWITVSLKSGTKYTPLSWIVSLVLFIALTIENALLFNAIEKRTYSDDIATSVKTSIDACLPSLISDYKLSYEEAQILALQLKVFFPYAAKYIKASQFEGHDVSEVADVLSKILHKTSSIHIWTLVGWILLTLIVGETIIFLTIKKERNNSYSRRISTHSYDDF